MATREELFAAVRLIKWHCRQTVCYCKTHWTCPLYDRQYDICITKRTAPEEWPDPEEGGGEDG